MFEKLLTNLPYNPSLVTQLGFYAKRMRREESIRRIGLLFIVLAFFVQFFAFISPPQSSDAYSSNDMIDDGIGSQADTAQADAVRDCQSNLKSYGSVLANFGISCAAVASAHVTSVRSTDTSGGQPLYSMGWTSYGTSYFRTHKPTNEIPFNNLTGVPSGNPIYGRLLDSFDSGPYSTYTALQGTTASGGTFFILFTCGNLVFYGPPKPIAPCPYNGAVLTGTPQCVKPCPYNSSIPITDTAACHPAPCPQDTAIYINNASCKACPYDQSILKGNKLCMQCPNPRYPTVIASSPTCKPVCPYNNAYDQSTPQCKPCTASVSEQDTLACVILHKSATNVTAGIANADGTTANPNDVITYTLTAKNNGKAVVKDFTMSENISDVLDYATVDTTAGGLHGGSISSTDQVTWPAADIAAGATLTHQITIQVLATIPSTAPDPGDPGHYDHIMTNTYGNTVNITVPNSPVAVIASASTTLVNTGPGSSLFIAGAIAIIAGYFFARSRLLVDESTIAVQETTSGGL